MKKVIFAGIFVAVIVWVIIVKTSVVSWQSTSMLPTISSGIYFENRFSYVFGKPQRGDVVILDLSGISQGGSSVKRIIGLPGEKVVIQNNSVIIYNNYSPDGVKLDEPYLGVWNGDTGETLIHTLGPDQYFVLGDNRDVSADSRLFGPVEGKMITAKLGMRL